MRHDLRWVLVVVSVLVVLGLGATLAMAQTQVQGEAPVPTVTSEPVVPTATRTSAELVGAGEITTTWAELLQRFGFWGAVGVVLVAAVLFVLKRFVGKAGEGLGDFLYRVFLGRWLKRREETIEAKDQKAAQAKARQSGLTAYFDWLEEELKHLPIIPIRARERQEQLLLEDVYVPLRVVERGQIEGFLKLIRGEFDPEDEYRVRPEAYQALDRSQGVYRMLSEPALLQQQAKTQSRERARRGESADEVLVEPTSTRLLLIGDAGSGKTTTLQYGALVLACDCREDRVDKAPELLDLHAPTPLVPFYIRLTLVATYVREAFKRAQGEALPGLQGAPSKLLLDWLDGYISTQMHKRGASLAADFSSHQLTKGGCLVMLDGLDETGDRRERAYMQRLIANLIQDYGKNRYLVASRPFEDLQLPGFDERHLSPLKRDEIEQLLGNWFGAVQKTRSQRAVEVANDHVAYLGGLIDANARLFEMATNPLLLTSMALLVHTGVGLPRERAELYNRLIYLLLDTWRTQQITGGLPGNDEGKTRYGGEESVKGIRRRLEAIAAWMQAEGRRELRLREVQAILRPVYQAYKPWDNETADDYIANLIESLSLESGLLQRRDGGFSFAHYTLQEYLTALAYDARERGIEELYQHWTNRRWRETILLAVGNWATEGPTKKAHQLIQRLLTTRDEAINAVLLAADALYDADVDRVVELAPLRSETLKRLHSYAFGEEVHPDPVLRNRAAMMLDRFGADNERPGLDLRREDYWAAVISPGTFRMGDNAGLYDDEKPAFDCTITASYALARFPVTNRQYLVFLEALAGRGEAEALVAAERLKPRLARHDEEPERFRPGTWPGSRYLAGTGNHPVRGVTWYAATAFAWWANEWLHLCGLLPAHETVRLPTEAEWERAAAYPVRLPGGTSADGRRTYPWGAWPDLTSAGAPRITNTIPANLDASGIGSTSVVGLFPHGRADCEAEELAGNVWEWCSTPYTTYPFKGEIRAEMLYNEGKKASDAYVLRGGSYYNDKDLARCVVRLDISPRLDDGYLGFRLARLFSSSSSS
ncbi:SUMF1/EgtB/PvdO family nonheme iron enzyme [Candidatus Chloroploca sp. M-50]|uniref:SUMF1/EgtB/PvdO family nonheme iron enzyme n=1 Tax=Candidatus Chloroploca mongolica TaxID=2528176 RepID=A0ABS4D7G1_9CHLR|nr:SUMF1/EgtB/PvdO family nonheme iron enzyme [Candidatus Chloroploca mongolica]MBP1465381.1 SUMF1/EgtB/PvdO family nonheme iron enzyme [Candidatus Chloroploca mongolica]